MKPQQIKVWHDKVYKQWCVLDQYGWSLMWFNKPSSARKARHLYRAYLTVNTDKEADHIIKLVRQLGETE